jgi:autotransporter-associated beta strand protein
LTLEASAQPLSSPVDIPLQLMKITSGPFPGDYRLGISVAINGGTPQLYLFDTGSAPFAVAFNPNTWGGFSGQTSVPASRYVGGTGYSYCYGGCTTAVIGNYLDIPSLTFPSANVTLTANPGYVVYAISSLTFGGSRYTFPDYFSSNPAAAPPFPYGPFYGIFGATNFAQGGPGGVLGQAVVAGATQGYVVAANYQANPDSSINPPQQANGINVMVGGRTQAVTTCTPCVTLGLTPQVIGQFAAVGPPGGTGGGGVIPVPSTDRAFHDPYIVLGGGAGNKSSSLPTFEYSLTASGASQPTVTAKLANILLDTGEPDFPLPNDLFDYGAPGSSLKVTGLAPGGATVPGMPTSTSVLGAGTYGAIRAYIDQGSLGIGFFMQNSVMFDLDDQVIGYSPFFVTDAPISTANGPLIVDGTNVPLGLAGVIQGAGGVIVNNGGALQLSATNTYTGPTNIAAGGLLLIAGPGSIANSSGVAVDGVFDISRAWLPVIIQALSGAGQVNLGGQSLILTNANGVFSGTLADGGAYPGTGGSLILAGGTQMLTGVSTYTGGTLVSGGWLILNGSVASSVAVGNGGLLSGNGLIGGDLVNFGMVIPGMLAPLSISGSYSQSPGSAYGVRVTALGQSDKLAIGGSAALGGTVMALPQAGAYAPRTAYTILTASGGVSGTYASVLSSSPFLRPSLSYDANDVYLTLQVGGFGAVAQNPTQSAVGGALDRAAPSATGDFANVLSALSQLNPGQVQPILASLSGMNYSGFSSTMVQASQLFMSSFSDMAGGANRTTSRLALAEACDVACDPAEPAKWGAWGGAVGGLGTIGSGAGLGGITYNLGGFAAGLDRRLSDTFLVGVTAGFTGGSQWASGFSGQGTSNTVQMGLYGSFRQGPAYLDGLAGYAFSNNTLSRGIVIPGLGSRTATGIAGVNQAYGQLEGGWRFDLGGRAEASLTPFARLQGYTGTQNGFTESGAQSLDLGVAAQTTNSLRTVLGAQVGTTMNLGHDKLNAQLRLGWSHEYADTSRPVSASFVGAPAAPFTTYGVSPARDGVVLGLTADTAVADATSIYLRYDGDFAGQDSSHALTAGVRLTW